VTLRALIVDDEPLARETLRLLLTRDAEIELAGDCSGVDAEELIGRTKPDILFLDIQMPEVDGFELLERIRPNSVPAIVFVTAYDQYALKAFEVHALDYLLKPFDDRRFAEALARAKEQARRKGEPGYVRRFLVRLREKVIFVRADDVDWIEAADYYSSLHVAGRAHLLRETMNDLEKQLDPERFVRIHRSAIVNVERVREMHPLFRGDAMLVLEDGTQLKLSRARRDEFERLLTRPIRRT
jgi:two-component system LytT family response regulator